ncbi:MAG: hypothetical protein AAFN80_17715 [Pseudomonadota bacterium]
MTEGNDLLLVQVIEATMKKLEQADELVICSETPTKVATEIAKAVDHIVPDTGLSFLEMSGVRALILQAISQPAFFDWEMPTLTGFSAEQFEAIAEKLPRE